MRGFLAALAALLIFASPPIALAQRIVVPPTTGGGGANQNLNNTYANCGQGSQGLGVLFTTVTGSVPTSYANLCTLGAAAAGGWLFVGPSNNSNARFMVTLRQNGATDFLVNQYVEVTTAGVVRIWVPAAIAAGNLDAKIQAGTGGHTAYVSFEAALTNAQSAPMYAVCEALNADTATTRPTGDVTVRTSGSTFDTNVASTSNAYGSLIFAGAGNSTSPATSQMALFSYAVGAAASETILADQSQWISGAATPFNLKTPINIDKSVGSGQRISTRAVAVVGTDVVRFAVTGCR